MDEAAELVDDTVTVDIQGYDADGEIIKAARANAEAAGVGHMIHFQQRPVSQLSHPKKYGFLITNPPYGERIEEKKNLPGLYTQLGTVSGRWMPGPLILSRLMRMWKNIWAVRLTATGRFIMV